MTMPDVTETTPAPTTEAEPEIVVHGYADAFEPTPEPVLTKTEARLQAAALDDPQAIMGLNYPGKEYLNTLYWRRIRLDSTSGAANRHMSGSKAARRRGSLTPDAIQKRLKAATDRLTERQAAVDGLDSEIAVIDAELGEIAGGIQAGSEVLIASLREKTGGIATRTGAAYQKHVIKAEHRLFPNLTSIDPRDIKGRLDEYKSALGLFAAEARDLAQSHADAVAAAEAERDEQKRVAATRKGALTRQRVKLVGDRVRRAGALAKAQGKYNQAKELAERLTEDAEEPTEGLRNARREG